MAHSHGRRDQGTNKIEVAGYTARQKSRYMKRAREMAKTSGARMSAFWSASKAVAPFQIPYLSLVSWVSKSELCEAKQASPKEGGSKLQHSKGRALDSIFSHVMRPGFSNNCKQPSTSTCTTLSHSGEKPKSATSPSESPLHRWELQLDRLAARGRAVRIHAQHQLAGGQVAPVRIRKCHRPRGRSRRAAEQLVQCRSGLLARTVDPNSRHAVALQGAYVYLVGQSRRR